MEPLLSPSPLLLKRGRNYAAYSRLRDSKLRSNHTPQRPKKPTTKFSAYSPVVAMSVPDLGAVLRKENRRPPPTPSKMRPFGSPLPPKGKVSPDVRRSYGCLKELKGFQGGGVGRYG